MLFIKRFNYRCRATNPQANKSRTSHGGRLVVNDGPGNLPLSILPVLHDDVITVTRGSRVVLVCPMVGDNKPKVSENYLLVDFDPIPVT